MDEVIIGLNNKTTYRFFTLSRFILFLIIFRVLFLPTTSNSQNDTAIEKVGFNKKYLVSYWKDTKIIVSTPFHWKLKQWSVFAGVVGIAAVTYIYDEEIYNAFQRNRNETTDAISKYAIEPWGSGLYSISLLGVIYLTGHNNNHHKNVALTGLKAYLLSGGASFVFKHLFHRHRPGDSSPPNPYLWEGPYPFTTDYTSFPSGHTTTAFAIASVLAQGYKDKLWIGLTSYSVATLVGLSRINDGKHWASDVVVGAALGTFIGTVLSRINFNERSNLSLNPAAFQGGYGINLTYRLD
ncbi:MAG: phosphatase PAP2 family protein [Bacteroidales bacterium]